MDRAVAGTATEVGAEHRRPRGMAVAGARSRNGRRPSFFRQKYAGPKPCRPMQPRIASKPPSKRACASWVYDVAPWVVGSRFLVPLVPGTESTRSSGNHDPKIA